MKLRLTRLTEGATTTVKIDGNLVRDWVEELVALCDSLEAVDGRLVLDLSGLLHADAAGVAALTSLRDAGAELAAASRYVELLLSNQDPVRAGRP